MTEPRSISLFCFPCAGTSAAGYSRWRRFAAPWLDIRPVELPGHGSRLSEPLERQFAWLVQNLTKEISKSLNGHYAFFGHSLGGLLAYACAHHLRVAGLPIPLAILVACSAAPSRRNDSYLAELRHDDELIERIIKLGGTAPELFKDSELLRMTLDTVAADFALCASFRYEARKPLETKIFVFGARDDDIDQESLLAWQQESASPIELEMFEGNHFFMRNQERQFVSILQDKLKAITSSEALE